MLVGEVGIEPTLTALSRQCLRVYKARPKANISNSPNLGYLMRIELMTAESQPAVLPLNYGHHQ